MDGEGDTVVVPGYVLGERLGVGGFGEVFAARHAVIGREVAIKVLFARYSADETAVARFVAEARAVNQIAHPNIVQVFDFGTLADGRRFCVMERIHGTTLRELLNDRGRVPLADAIPILRGIAAAVDAAHTAGIAHRDLKPDNVFVLPDGGVKLIDFGLAKLTREDPATVPVTRAGAIFGTPLYMSPEQCRGKDVGARTDCYSFGVLAYHILVGQPPWSGDALELALHHLNDDPVPPSERCPDLDDRVDRLLGSLLAKVPARRPFPLLPALDALDARRRPRRRSYLLAVLLALASILAITAVVVLNRERATPGWSWRALSWPAADIATSFGLSPNGEALYYVHPDRTVWRRGVDEREPQRVDLVEPGAIRSVSALGDGRLLISREQDDGHWIWLETPAGTRERITQGEHGRVGPGDRIAFVRGGELYLRDLIAQQDRLVASVGGTIVNITWSPDGQRLAWIRGVPNNDSRAEILELRDGTIRPLPGVLIKVSVEPLPLAFVGPTTIVYCDARRRVVELDLQTGRKVTVRALAPNVGACAVESSRDGHRVVIAAVALGLSSGVLSLQTPERGWRRLAAGGVEEFTAAGDVVVAGWPAPGPVRHRTIWQQDFQLPPVTVIPTAGGTPRVVSVCSGAAKLVRRGDELLFNVNVANDSKLAMQLVRASDCGLVESWTLPDLPNWMFPRCGGDVCATVRETNGELGVWVLRRGEPSGRELARMQTKVSATPWLDLAVSPDGRAIAVVVPGARDDIFVIDASLGTVRTLHSGPLPGARDVTNSAASVTWAADSRAVYVTGGRADLSAITKVTLDGERTVVWSGAAVSIGLWARTSPDGAWLAANMLDVGLDVQLVTR